MKEQSPEERIRFLEHGVQWRSDLLDQWKVNQAKMWNMVDAQFEMIEAIKKQRDRALEELARLEKEANDEMGVKK